MNTKYANMWQKKDADSYFISHGYVLYSRVVDGPQIGTSLACVSHLSDEGHYEWKIAIGGRTIEGGDVANLKEGQQAIEGRLDEMTADGTLTIS